MLLAPAIISAPLINEELASRTERTLNTMLTLARASSAGVVAAKAYASEAAAQSASTTLTTPKKN